MGNSTLVALALFALFLVYITARGRLPQYLAVLFGKVTSDQGTSAGSSAASATQGAANLAGNLTGLLGGTSGSGGAYTTGSALGTTGGL